MIDSKEFRKFAVGHQGLPGSNVDKYIDNTRNMTRSIIEERPANFREIDVFSRLMADRIIFLGTGVDQNIGNIITAQLLFLESVDSVKDILMYINSPGGSVYAGLGMYDTMQYIKPDVATVCTGMAASMGAVLLAAGAPGKRTALPHARVMIHQPSGGYQGTSKDMEIDLIQMQELRKDLYKILSHHTSQTYDKIHEDCDRDNWFRAEDAKDYGLIDEVLVKH